MSIEPQARRNLMRLATAYRDATGLTLGTIAVRSGKDSKFFHRVSGTGPGFTFRTYDDVVSYFHKNWPDGHDIPEIEDLSHHKPRVKR